MSTNLYDALGVAKSASKADVRKAYRKKAKKAHPDGGGDAQSFALVKLAHDTLSDDARRAHYDATGNADDAAIDNQAAEAVNIAMGAINGVLAEIERRGGDPCAYDIVSDAKNTVKTQISTQDQNITNTDRTIKRMRKLIGRFKAKKGKRDRITPMIESSIAHGERNLEAQKKQLETLKLAHDILNEHTFDADMSGYGQANYGAQASLPKFILNMGF